MLTCLLAQWQQVDCVDTEDKPLAFASLATRKSGGVTSLRSAQSSFSRSVWQQHLSQQCSAVEHPHGQFSHGKRSADCPSNGFSEGTAIKPVSANTTASSKSHNRPCLALLSRIKICSK